MNTCLPPNLPRAAKRIRKILQFTLWALPRDHLAIDAYADFTSSPRQGASRYRHNSKPWKGSQDAIPISDAEKIPAGAVCRSW